MSPLYSVARVKVDVAKGEKIGSKRSGYFCLPHGSVVWGRDAAPSDDRLWEAVSRGLEKAGLAVPSTDADLFEQMPPVTPYLIAAVVRNAKFSTCVPGIGVGDGSSVKGTAKLNGEWKVYSHETKSVIAALTTSDEVAVSADEGIGLEALFLRALEGNAETFARSTSEVSRPAE